MGLVSGAWRKVPRRFFVLELMILTLIAQGGGPQPNFQLVKGTPPGTRAEQPDCQTSGRGLPYTLTSRGGVTLTLTDRDIDRLHMFLRKNLILENLRDETISEPAPGTFNWASYYGNYMVLQQGPHRAVLWGYGEVGATVNISITSGGFYSTTVYKGDDGQGVWKVSLDPMPPGGPHKIHGIHDVKGTLQRISLDDVMFGDVWVCSGQSNMEFTLFDLDKILQPWAVASQKVLEVQTGSTSLLFAGSLGEICTNTWATPSDWWPLPGPAQL